MDFEDLMKERAINIKTSPNATTGDLIFTHHPAGYWLLNKRSNNYIVSISFVMKDDYLIRQEKKLLVILISINCLSYSSQ